MLQAIADDLQRAKVEREKPIGLEVTAAVTRESKVECPLSNLVADLMLRASPGADAAFSNAGSIRIPLQKGPLSYGTVFEMMPFDNAFATLHITASQLSSILARNLSVSSGILALSGLSAAASCAHGKLEVALFDAKGQRVEPTRELTVITSDFLANSGDGLLAGISIDPKAITIERNRLIRDALLDGLMTYPGGKLDGDDKRLYDPAHPRLRYPGPRPVRCEAVNETGAAAVGCSARQASVTLQLLPLSASSISLLSSVVSDGLLTRLPFKNIVGVPSTATSSPSLSSASTVGA